MREWTWTLSLYHCDRGTNSRYRLSSKISEKAEVSMIEYTHTMEQVPPASATEEVYSIVARYTLRTVDSIPGRRHENWIELEPRPPVAWSALCRTCESPEKQHEQLKSYEWHLWTYALLSCP